MFCMTMALAVAQMICMELSGTLWTEIQLISEECFWWFFGPVSNRSCLTRADTRRRGRGGASRGPHIS